MVLVVCPTSYMSLFFCHLQPISPIALHSLALSSPSSSYVTAAQEPPLSTTYTAPPHYLI